MKKKLVCIAMALILSATSAVICANAAEVKEEPSGETGTIKFDMGDWDNDDQVCFYIWDATNGQCCTKNGWQDGDTWGSKKLLGTNLGDGIVESYEFTIPEGHDVFVIFHDKTTNVQTFDCVLTDNAFGDTAYMTGTSIENPVDSEQTAIEVAFKNATDCGAHLTITSTGKVVGKVLAPNDDSAKIVADYVFNYIGLKDKSGEECCTAEKVANAVKAFDTTADDVWAKFQEKSSEEGYSEIVDESKTLINPTTKYIDDKMEYNAYLVGDINGDEKITAADAMLLQRYTINLTNLTDEQQAVADVNGDGKITALDALQVLRYTIDMPTDSLVGTYLNVPVSD